MLPSFSVIPMTWNRLGLRACEKANIVKPGSGSSLAFQEAKTVEIASSN